MCINLYINLQDIVFRGEILFLLRKGISFELDLSHTGRIKQNIKSTMTNRVLVYKVASFLSLQYIIQYIIYTTNKAPFQLTNVIYIYTYIYVWHVLYFLLYIYIYILSSVIFTLYFEKRKPKFDGIQKRERESTCLYKSKFFF